jgi:hypothetical protein
MAQGSPGILVVGTLSAIAPAPTVLPLTTWTLGAMLRRAQTVLGSCRLESCLDTSGNHATVVNCG